MIPSLRLPAACASILAVVSVWSCTNAEPATNFGPAGKLSRGDLPGEAGAETLTCGDAGGGPVAGGTCGVSWSKDVFPKFGQGAWACNTAACHGPGSSQPPQIPTDPTGALTALKAYKLQAIAYIATTGKPEDSSILCNLGGTCGTVMPIGAGRPLTPDERCILQAWVACGAPSN